MDPIDVIDRLTAMYEAMGREREEQEETQRRNEEVIEGLRRTIDGKKAEEKDKNSQIEACKEENKKQEEVLEGLEKEEKELEKILAALTNPDETPSQTGQDHNDITASEAKKKDNNLRDEEND
ncbi:unnamed protein product [Caenorhabditis brenneri]